MRRGYRIFGVILFALYGFVELTGRELSAGERGVIPAGARNSGGFRSYHYWNGGK